MSLDGVPFWHCKNFSKELFEHFAGSRPEYLLLQWIVFTQTAFNYAFEYCSDLMQNENSVIKCMKVLFREYENSVAFTFCHSQALKHYNKLPFFVYWGSECVLQLVEILSG